MSEVKQKTFKQEFAIQAPAALRVQLLGDFTGWSRAPITMSKGTDGVWRTRVDLPAGSYHYRFMVDGEWRDDPNCTLRVPNPFGTENAVREVEVRSSVAAVH